MTNKIFIFIFGILFIPSILSAQTPNPSELGAVPDVSQSYTNKFDYVLLEPLPGFKNTVAETDFASFAQQLINLIIAISAVAAVFMFTVGGFQYLTGETFQMKTDGKDRMTNSIVGLLLILCAYLILYTINPQLVNLNLIVSPAQKQTPTQVGGTLSQEGTQIQPGSRESAPYSSVTKSDACANCYTVVAQGVGTCIDCMKLDGFFALNLDGLGACSTQKTTGCYVDSELATGLFGLKSKLGNIAITEAWPPTVKHQNPCHVAGTCVDIGENYPPQRETSLLKQYLLIPLFVPNTQGLIWKM